MKTLVVVQPETDIEFEYMRSEFPILCHAPKYPLFAMTGKQRDDLTERIRRHQRLEYDQVVASDSSKYSVLMNAVTPRELSQLFSSVSNGIPLAYLAFEHSKEVFKNVCIISVDTGSRNIVPENTASAQIQYIQA